MIKLFLLTLLFSAIFNSSFSQKSSELGLEYMRYYGQGYKSSTAGARYESYSSKSSWSVGLTYTLPSKSSYGGSRGIGMYAGYRYGIGNGTKGNLFAGARVILAFVNFDGKTSLNSLVCTPMAELGYHLLLSKSKSFFASPSIGYGFTKKITKEFNSMDEDEGARVIPSLSAGFRF